MITLKQFLAELTFIQIKEIKRHSKGLLLALEKSNRKDFLTYMVIPKICQTEKMKAKEPYEVKAFVSPRRYDCGHYSTDKYYYEDKKTGKTICSDCHKK